MNAQPMELTDAAEEGPQKRILVTRLNANSPITVGPFVTMEDAEAVAIKMKAESPISEVVFSAITRRVVANPEPFLVEDI